LAYTDFASKIILHRYGAVKVVMAEAGSKGDIITVDGYLADAEDAKPGFYGLCEDAAVSEDAWCALAVEIKKPATASGPPNTWARGDHSGVLGTVLYLDGGADEGEACESAGTIPQIVGYVTSQDTALLCPMNYLTGTNLSLSGTLAVTGATTLTGLLTANGGITVATTKNLTLVKGLLKNTEGNIQAVLGDIIATKGAVTLTEGNVTLTKGRVDRHITADVDTAYAVLDSDDKVVCTLTADRTLTLPAAAAGKMVTFIHQSGDFVLKVVADTGDKLLDAAGAAKDNVVDDKGLDVRFTLLAIDATNWVTTQTEGGLTYA